MKVQYLGVRNSFGGIPHKNFNVEADSRDVRISHDVVLETALTQLGAALQALAIVESCPPTYYKCIHELHFLGLLYGFPKCILKRYMMISYNHLKFDYWLE
jgi:hypothetical protein